MNKCVDLLEFKSLAAKHYRAKTGKILSVKQMQLWLDIANVCNKKIQNDGNESFKLQLLPFPTGIGKTTALAVYLAALSKQSTGAKTAKCLVVIREIEQIDRFVEEVNSIAGQQVAIADHSKSHPSMDMVDESCILVVSHMAYAMALSSFLDEPFSNKVWLYKFRDLVVVDEEPSVLFEELSVPFELLQELLTLSKAFLQGSFTKEQALIQSVHNYLAHLNNKEMAAESFPDEWCLEQIDLVEFGNVLEMVVEQSSLISPSPGAMGGAKSLITQTTRSLRFMLENWFLFETTDEQKTMTASRLLLPDDIPLPLVFDATAELSHLWQRAPFDVDFIRPSVKSRTYTNVSLHVCREHGNGKDSGKQEQRFKSLVQQQSDKKQKTFVVTHERHIAKLRSLISTDPMISYGHWFSLDGKNDWHDCDAAYFTTLPNLPLELFSSIELAKNPPAKRSIIFKNEGQGADAAEDVAARLVQAMNRIKCRVPIDNEGNCATCDIYLYVNPGERGDRIIDLVRGAMPDISVLDWKPELQETATTGSSKVANLFLDAVKAKKGTIATAKEVSDELGFSTSQRYSLNKMLKDKNHWLRRRLEDWGCGVNMTGHTRTRRIDLRIPSKLLQGPRP